MLPPITRYHWLHLSFEEYLGPKSDTTLEENGQIWSICLPVLGPHMTPQSQTNCQENILPIITIIPSKLIYESMSALGQLFYVGFSDLGICGLLRFGFPSSPPCSLSALASPLGHSTGLGAACWYTPVWPWVDALCWSSRVRQLGLGCHGWGNYSTTWKRLGRNQIKLD